MPLGVFGSVLAACLIGQANQTVQPVRAQDLKRLSIEELSDLDITSVSRRTEKLLETPAAVSVINQEDIRRSGVTTLGESMRLADALDVARVNSSTWAISARGFNTNPANKLLVMINGRTVYSPLFSGTFWDAQDVLMADVDRIEVIRGPGGAVWGANAVNGVINVITKDAAATRGDYVSVAGGSDEHAYAAARHGGHLGSEGSFRVYGKYRRRGAQVFSLTGASAHDPVQFGQGGFRIESGRTSAARWFVEGDLYRGTNGFDDRPDGDIGGGDIVGRWSRRFSSTAEFQAQVSYDRTFRKVPRQFEETRDTFNADTQHHVRLARHDIVVGGGFRVTRGDDLGTAGFLFDPQVRTSTLVSLFLQDDISLKLRTVFLTLGSKFERNDFTGVEVQPSVRVRWIPGASQTMWAAVSRGVRLPTRLDTDLRLVDINTRRVTLTGTETFKSEEVVAWEAGYRMQPSAWLMLDASAFANRYDNLRSTELTFTPLPLIVLENRLNVTASGLELGATVQPLLRWRVHGWYAYLDKNLSFDAGSRDFYRGTVEGNDPAHQLSLRSYVDLPHGLAFDAFLRRVGKRPDPVVGPYSELDLRLGWTIRQGWEISASGRNLLHRHHAELQPPSAVNYSFRRGFVVRTEWRF